MVPESRKLAENAEIVRSVLSGHITTVMLDAEQASGCCLAKTNQKIHAIVAEVNNTTKRLLRLFPSAGRCGQESGENDVLGRS